MSFNIQRFRSMIDRGGVSKPSAFEVQIHRPFGNSINMERDLMFRCASCTIPGRHMNTADTTEYSLPRYVGYQSTFDDVSMRIILSEDMREKIYFDEWLDEIGGDYRTGSLHNQMFDVGFYDDYALNTMVNITQFSVTGEPVHIHQLREAFPISIGALETDWADDSIHYLTVVWKYRYYTNEIIK